MLSALSTAIQRQSRIQGQGTKIENRDRRWIRCRDSPHAVQLGLRTGRTDVEGPAPLVDGSGLLG